ncbi:MAG: bifunctional folylpolyglutamate synthase/dihydrofolate synthase [Chlorobiaceae bacterium]|nr:bifunctional folylpolyglutamate synthase/dihydrofolate synthase [Chlorobiaceae bacterium]
MEYQEAIDFLFPLHRFGIKPGLDRIEALLDALDHPERRLGTIVHIAGTNGKGTVASCMASIFQASGRKTGLFTSPHLIDFTERIRIDGRQISREKVARYCSLLKPTIIAQGATFFEVTTAMAFAFFAEEGVDAAVIETGMGGRLDATNTVRADIVIIPSIGIDHTAWLGNTLREIAAEKAAIIKPGSRVYTAVQEGDGLDEIRRSAERCGAQLHQAGADASYTVFDAQPGMFELELSLSGGEPHRLRVPLTGSFHASNVTLAVMAARSAGIDWASIETGLSRLAAVGYRARLEKVAERPLVMLDVSHNPDGMEKSVQALVEMRGSFRSLFVMLGVAADKDAAGIIKPLQRIADVVVAVDLPSERSLSAESLGAMCVGAGFREVHVRNTALDGLNLLFSLAAPQDLILVTGSFFLAGEVASMERFNGGFDEPGS